MIGGGPTGCNFCARADPSLRIELWEAAETLGGGGGFRSLPAAKDGDEDASSSSSTTAAAAVAVELGAQCVSFDDYAPEASARLEALRGSHRLRHVDDGMRSCEGGLSRTKERPQGWNRAFGRWEHFRALGGSSSLLRWLVPDAVPVRLGRTATSIRWEEEEGGGRRWRVEGVDSREKCDDEDEDRGSGAPREATHRREDGVFFDIVVLAVPPAAALRIDGVAALLPPAERAAVEAAASEGPEASSEANGRQSRRIDGYVVAVRGALAGAARAWFRRAKASEYATEAGDGGGGDGDSAGNDGARKHDARHQQRDGSLNGSDGCRKYGSVDLATLWDDEAVAAAGLPEQLLNASGGREKTDAEGSSLWRTVSPSCNDPVTAFLTVHCKSSDETTMGPQPTMTTTTTTTTTTDKRPTATSSARARRKLVARGLRQWLAPKTDGPRNRHEEGRVESGDPAPPTMTAAGFGLGGWLGPSLTNPLRWFGGLADDQNQEEETSGNKDNSAATSKDRVHENDVDDNDDDDDSVVVLREALGFVQHASRNAAGVLPGHCIVAGAPPPAPGGGAENCSSSSSSSSSSSESLPRPCLVLCGDWCAGGGSFSSCLLSSAAAARAVAHAVAVQRFNSSEGKGAGREGTEKEKDDGASRDGATPLNRPRSPAATTTNSGRSDDSNAGILVYLGAGAPLPLALVAAATAVAALGVAVAAAFGNSESNANRTLKRP